MNPEQLIREGRLAEAIQVISGELRDHPADTRRRTFLFELLCFAGQYERAEKHLNALAQASRDAELGGLLYRSALAAERRRQLLFESGIYSSGATDSKPSGAGRLNGRPFRTIEDLDPRIGPRLEIFVAGEYVWLPFEHVSSLRMAAPKYLRDTLWASAVVQVGPAFQDREFGEVLLPMLSPFSWKHESDQVKLGRATDWKPQGELLIPFGQKLLLLDDEEAVPMLEVRELYFEQPVAADPASFQSVGA